MKDGNDNKSCEKNEYKISRMEERQESKEWDTLGKNSFPLNIYYNKKELSFCWKIGVFFVFADVAVVHFKCVIMKECVSVYACLFVWHKQFICLLIDVWARWDVLLFS